MARIAQRTALQALATPRLLELATTFELEVSSGLRKPELVDALAGSRRAPLWQILELLRRDELKAICRAVGLDDTGREKARIIERILGRGQERWRARRRRVVPGADTLTRNHLVLDVAEATGLPKVRAEVVVNAALESLIDGLRAGAKIELRGFGNFGVRHRKPRTGRNPRTGSEVRIPAKRVAYFKPGKVLRALLNP